MFSTIIKTILAIIIATLLITVPVFFAKGMSGTAWSEFWMAMIMVFVACAIDEDS